MLSQLALIEDSIRASHLSHVKYIMDRAESGNVKVVVEFSSDLNHVNATVVTPVNGYEYVQVPLRQQLFEGMTEGEPPVGWHFVMDNTRFSVASLYKMMQGQSSKSSSNSVQYAINAFITYVFKHHSISLGKFHTISSSVFFSQKSALSTLKPWLP